MARGIPAGSPVCTLVLVGFMASGKTTVGRLLAERLGWSFTDVDAEIERHTGSSIAAIFRDQGEQPFRDIERELTADLVQRPDIVVATGGGWAARQEALDSLPATARSVWLRVSVDEALRRARVSSTIRPLLETADPAGTAADLLQSRERYYEQADITVDVDGRSAHDVADVIVQLLGDI